ncbi:hypothetical protein ABZ468_42975 [Streptomyces sp. NPDC005708]|uniref:hypothetical protein n=1 Tax=Streptomyces sp. NPDC005708 TaxID=3154564 RepID=UPI0033C9EFE3
MKDDKAPTGSGVKMKIRVYTVDADGEVTQDRGTVTSLPHSFKPARESLVGGFPPCRCPRHRAGGER